MSHSPLRASLVASVLLLACRAPATGIELPPADARHPTLEELFLEPPLTGYAPTASSLSIDGEWCVLRWSPDAAEASDGELRLLHVSDPLATNGRGAPLASLLPARGEPEEAAISVAVWSPTRVLLAVARDREVWLLEPGAGAPTRLYEEPEPAADEAPPREPTADEAAPPEATEATPPTAVTPVTGGTPPTGRVRSLAFTRAGDELRFSDRQELYSLPIPAAGMPATSAWSDVRWWSAELDAAALSLQWSDDLAIVYGKDVRAPEADEVEEDGLDEPEAGPAQEDAAPPEEELHLQVLRRDEGRRVELMGMAGMPSLESARLSPDGRFVFGVDVDRSADPEPTLVPNWLSERVTTRPARRKLADDGPSPRVLWIWNTATGERAAVEPFGPDAAPEPEPGAGVDEAAETEAEPAAAREPWWFSPIGWAPQHVAGKPARYAFERWSADFRELEIWCWTEGFCERLWFERDERWVGGPARYARWSEDGDRLLVGSEGYAGSSTPGRCQLFAVDPDTRAVRQLTAVAGEVARFRNTGDGGLVLEASADDPARRRLLRLGREAVLSAGAGPPPAADTYAGTDVGWNESPLASADGRRVVFAHEELLRPAEIHTATLAETARLTRTIPTAFRRIAWILPERVTLTAPDGARVRAHVYLPRGVTLDAPGPPRAAIVFVHGAGYLQNVTDSMTRYPLNMMFHSRLADLGYPVIDVDYRGSAGYGRDFRTDVQYHLGGLDLDDIHLVVDHLAERGLVDPERVGLYGGSYGGFLTLMALFTAPERWACGAALRSVTDWRTYHPRYTQPRLGRPSTHPEAYARSSPIDHVDGLEDPLLLLHGMMDANVFAQDSVRLIEAMIDRQLDFDAMLYPSQGHGFRDGPHWLDEYRRIERFLLRHLGAPVASRN